MDALHHHPVFEKVRPWEGLVEAGFMANFLGVKTRLEFFQTSPSPMVAQRAKPGLPGFDEEYFEWIDLLEAVMLASGQFVMIELGAGWGRWITNAAFALKHANDLPYHLVGVEPEPTHFVWMRKHLQDNGLDLSRCQLIEAAVTATEGTVWFYVGKPAEWYGQAIASKVGPATPTRWPGYVLAKVLGLFRSKSKASIRSNEVQKVKATSLAPLLRGFDRVDLIDLDVQGAELDVLLSARDLVDQSVRRVHIGTHGPEIEQGLRNLFGELGWKNLHDYGCGQECLTPHGKIQFQDGVQSWINPKLQRVDR